MRTKLTILLAAMAVMMTACSKMGDIEIPKAPKVPSNPKPGKIDISYLWSPFHGYWEVHAYYLKSLSGNPDRFPGKNDYSLIYIDPVGGYWGTEVVNGRCSESTIFGLLSKEGEILYGAHTEPLRVDSPTPKFRSPDDPHYFKEKWRLKSTGQVHIRTTEWKKFEVLRDRSTDITKLSVTHRYGHSITQQKFKQVVEACLKQGREKPAAQLTRE